ncbi:hypothetical protein [Streptomyces sp. NPDC059009]|uniref:hypothetical protein n=1 Tax=Streptomyces sp. NPDC059009 TaxID=3346694 RepID=UPI0036990736
MPTARRVLGAAATAALALLAVPTAAHADDENLTTVFVPAGGQVNSPVKTEELRSVPDALEKVVGKLAVDRDDKVKQKVLGG